MDLEQLLAQDPRRAEAQREVGQRRNRRAQLPEHRGASDDPIAQRQALLALELVARLGVDLGDFDSLRADLRADPATGAVVNRPIHGGLVGHPVALRLRAGVLGSREQGRDVGHRADRLADGALDAVVKRPAQELVQDSIAHLIHPAALTVSRAPSLLSTSWATRQPLASAIPSPDPSRQGTAPGSAAPATSTLSIPSARSLESTATPARAIGCSAR